jgi:hypothetical protein
MKILVDENLKGKALYEFLVKNKMDLIQQKKASIKTTDAVCFSPSLFNVKGDATEKADIGAVPDDATKVRVKIVGNACMWMDSQKDVLLRESSKKTIKDGNGRLHLKDHTYKLEAEVGDVVNVYLQDVSLTELGLQKAGTTQCIIYESDVQKSYDEKVFTKYKKGKINQHSIGLRYADLKMAINDEDYKEEFANWNAYIDQIINRDEAEESGYFWVVPEIKLVEVSAVLAGANILTPTLSVGKQSEESTDEQPQKSTEQQPQEVFDWKGAIAQTTFIKI